LARRSGRKAARAEQAAEAAKSYIETRKRADAALRRAQADTRPADDRLAEHGRLRDD